MDIFLIIFSCEKNQVLQMQASRPLLEISYSTYIRGRFIVMSVLLILFSVRFGYGFIFLITAFPKRHRMMLNAKENICVLEK